MTIELDQEQYLALISLARKGADTPDKKRVLENFLKDIDAANGVSRYVLLVQWQEADAPLPKNADFPVVWPPSMRLTLERTDRPIAKSDVTKAVAAKASNPVEVLVTRDLGGIVGWVKLNDFFVT